MQIDTEIKEPNFQKMTTNDLFGSHLKGAFRNEEWETHVRSTLAASRHTVRYEIPWRFLKRSIHRFEAVKSEMSNSVAISVAFSRSTLPSKFTCAAQACWKHFRSAVSKSACFAPWDFLLSRLRPMALASISAF